jgi:uncharacterized protein (TIGR03435 family)
LKLSFAKGALVAVVSTVVLTVPIIAGLAHGVVSGSTATTQVASEKFEVVSIRPAAPDPPGPVVRGGPELEWAWVDVCGYPGPRPWDLRNAQLTPGRLTLTRVTLFRVITLAYGKNCRAALEIGLLEGLPDWGRSETFDITATIPAGSPNYTVQELQFGDAPVLQMMLQNMLTDRFGLSLHRVTKEAALYNLQLVSRERIRLSKDQTPVAPTPEPNGPPDPTAPLPRGTLLVGVDPPNGKVWLYAASMPIKSMINVFQGQEARLVSDKTGLKGLYDIPEVELDVGPFEITGKAVSVWPEIMRQLGFKLEPARGPVEVLVVDRVTMPSAN